MIRQEEIKGVAAAAGIVWYMVVTSGQWIKEGVINNSDAKKAAGVVEGEVATMLTRVAEAREAADV